jgi:hypothetical protein
MRHNSEGVLGNVIDFIPTKQLYWYEPMFHRAVGNTKGSQPMGTEFETKQR